MNNVMDEEALLSILEPRGGCAQFTSEILPAAARELAAFARAVTELFGSEPARWAVDDWVEELELSDWAAASAAMGFRQITIAAAARLTQRIKPPAVPWREPARPPGEAEAVLVF